MTQSTKLWNAFILQINERVGKSLHSWAVSHSSRGSGVVPVLVVARIQCINDCNSSQMNKHFETLTKQLTLLIHSIQHCKAIGVKQWHILSLILMFYFDNRRKIMIKQWYKFKVSVKESITYEKTMQNK